MIPLSFAFNGRSGFSLRWTHRMAVQGEELLADGDMNKSFPGTREAKTCA